MDKTLRVLFLTRGSASRAQMAAGLLRRLAGDKIMASSAGTEKSSVSPLATEVMLEDGINISNQTPQEIPSLFRDNFHYVVSLCDEERERYALFPFARKSIRWSVPDPETVNGSPEIRKQAFRRVRDQLKGRVKELVEAVDQPAKAA